LKLSNPKAAAFYRFGGDGFRGARLPESGFGGSSFKMPILKGCFFLWAFTPSVGPLDEREMLLPEFDLPPPLALPLLTGLIMVTD